MEVPLKLSFRNVLDKEAVESLIRERVSRIEHLFNHVTSFNVAVEKAVSNHLKGNPFRVRVEVKVPRHDIVLLREPGRENTREPLLSVIREAFNAAEKRLKKLNEKQHLHDTNTYPFGEVGGVITEFHPEEGFGFIESKNGKKVYFSRESVMSGDLEKLEKGSSVIFIEETETLFPHASAVKLAD